MKLSSSREREADRRFREKLKEVDWFYLPIGFGINCFTVQLDGHFTVKDLLLISKAMTEYFEDLEREENAAN